MFKIILTNYKTGFVYDIVKPTLEEANLEVERHLALENLFKPQREIKAFSEDYEERDVIARRTLDQDGVITELVTLKQEHVVEIEDITEVYNLEKQIAEDIASGERIELACNKLTRFLNGYLDRKNFSKEQEDIFDLSLAKIFSAIDRLKIKKLRKLIEELDVDGQIITNKLKDNCLSILTKNNF